MSRRRATLRTTHENPEAIARSLAPDNTAQMDTRVEGTTVVTAFERGTTGGLRSTLDDYVVNLQVAAELTEGQTDEHAATADTATDEDTDTNHE